MAFPPEYKRLVKIGEGGFARIYMVRHKELGYIRAMKISKEIIDDENDKAYQAFMNECKLLLQIGNGSHPSIVHIYTPRIVGGQAVVEMDYIDGKTVTDYVRANRFVSMKEFRRFSEDIAGALAYCHADLYRFRMDPEQDNLETDPDDGSRYLISPEKEKELQKKYCICHNDLHSNNIMRRNYDGHYILLDFGLAIQEGNCVRSSARQDGATEYCSPEKLDNGNFSGTPASDIYSFGIVMYEMLTGAVPFPMKNSSLAETSRVIDAHIHTLPEPVAERRKAAYQQLFPGKTYTDDMPEGLEAIVMRCLAKNPADRYADAKELKTDLDLMWMQTDQKGVTDVDTQEIIAGLNREIERLKEENRQLKMQSAMPATSSYYIGQPMDGGRICYIDSTGNHGLVKVKQSDVLLNELRFVEEGDFDRFNPPSKAWYRDNCFILPRQTHLPSQREAYDIINKSGALGIPGLLWYRDDFGKLSILDTSTGSSSPATKAMFVAVKAF